MAEKTESSRRLVDMWALPGLHPSNVELLQKLKTADSHQFTTNMDCVGQISDRDPETKTWQKTHLVGVRTDVWKPDAEELDGVLNALKKQRQADLKKQIKRSGRLNDEQKEQLESTIQDCAVMQMTSSDLVSRRLVLKLFKTTGTRVRWVGTLEQVTTNEVHNSIGSNRALLSLAVMLPRTKVVTTIQQNHRTFRIPSVFTSGFYDGERMWNVVLKRRWISLGPHFDIQADGQTVGEIDGHLVSLGADCTLKLGTHPLAKNSKFRTMLTLFSASIGFHKAMRRSVNSRVQAALSGESYRHVIDSDELRLHHNGRAAA